MTDYTKRRLSTALRALFRAMKSAAADGDVVAADEMRRKHAALLDLLRNGAPLRLVKPSRTRSLESFLRLV
jgi:hypothetical protein